KGLAPQAAPDVTVPTELDERRQGMIDNLRAASAEDFDRVYIDQQVAAHNEAVTLHRGFSDNSDAPQLAQHAGTVLPKIEAHLQHAERLDDRSIHRVDCAGPRRKLRGPWSLRAAVAAAPVVAAQPSGACIRRRRTWPAR